MKYPKTLFTLAALAIFSFTTAHAQETGQESGASIPEAPAPTEVVVTTFSNLENPLVTVPVIQVTHPVVYYRSPTPAHRSNHRSWILNCYHPLSATQGQTTRLRHPRPSR